jgi:hypothetical protein
MTLNKQICLKGNSMSTNKVLRVGTVEAKELLPKLETMDFIDIDNNRVKMRSHRYKCFKKSGLKCVVCGIEGTIFAIEKHFQPSKKKEAWDQTWFHFNLYAINEAGQEVLMTRDHTIPKSKGGKNSVDNAETMCKPCNGAKADIYIEPPLRTQKQLD